MVSGVKKIRSIRVNCMPSILLKAFRGRGIGRTPIRNTALRLLDLNVFSMLAWVLSDNASKAFYEKMGRKYLREKPIEFGGSSLLETAYGWGNVRLLLGES